jgi:hypothetical protein
MGCRPPAPSPTPDASDVTQILRQPVADVDGAADAAGARLDAAAGEVAPVAGRRTPRRARPLFRRSRSPPQRSPASDTAMKSPACRAAPEREGFASLVLGSAACQRDRDYDVDGAHGRDITTPHSRPAVNMPL